MRRSRSLKKTRMTRSRSSARAHIKEALIYLLIGQKTLASLVDDRGEASSTKGRKSRAEAFEAIPQMYWNVIEVDCDRRPDGRAHHSMTCVKKFRRFVFSFRKRSTSSRRATSCLRASSRWSRYTLPSSVSFRWATRWLVDMVIRGSSPELPKRICRSLPDGTPVEMVLNPFGVPSRMNIGQIL